eukprot:jgi/Mesvir1/9182/Mv06917-RA.2
MPPKKKDVEEVEIPQEPPFAMDFLAVSLLVAGVEGSEPGALGVELDAVRRAAASHFASNAAIKCHVLELEELEEQVLGSAKGGAKGAKGGGEGAHPLLEELKAAKAAMVPPPVAKGQPPLPPAATTLPAGLKAKLLEGRIDQDRKTVQDAEVARRMAEAQDNIKAYKDAQAALAKAEEKLAKDVEAAKAKEEKAAVPKAAPKLAEEATKAREAAKASKVARDAAEAAVNATKAAEASAQAVLSAPYKVCNVYLLVGFAATAQELVDITAASTSICGAIDMRNDPPPAPAPGAMPPAPERPASPTAAAATATGAAARPVSPKKAPLSPAGRPVSPKTGPTSPPAATPEPAAPADKAPDTAAAPAKQGEQSPFVADLLRLLPGLPLDHPGRDVAVPVVRFHMPAPPPPPEADKPGEPGAKPGVAQGVAKGAKPAAAPPAADKPGSSQGARKPPAKGAKGGPATNEWDPAAALLSAAASGFQRTVTPLPKAVPDKGVDLTYYHKLMDAVPPVQVDANIVLHCIVEQVARSEASVAELAAAEETTAEADAAGYLASVFARIVGEPADAAESSRAALGAVASMEAEAGQGQLERAGPSFGSNGAGPAAAPAGLKLIRDGDDTAALAELVRYLPPRRTATFSAASLDVAAVEKALAAMVAVPGDARRGMPPAPTLTVEERGVQLSGLRAAVKAHGLPLPVAERYQWLREFVSLLPPVTAAAHAHSVLSRYLVEPLPASTLAHAVQQASLGYSGAATRYFPRDDALLLAFYCHVERERTHIEVPHTTPFREYWARHEATSRTPQPPLCVYALEPQHGTLQHTVDYIYPHDGAIVGVKRYTGKLPIQETTVYKDSLVLGLRQRAALVRRRSQGAPPKETVAEEAAKPAEAASARPPSAVKAVKSPRGDSAKTPRGGEAAKTPRGGAAAPPAPSAPAPSAPPPAPPAAVVLTNHFSLQFDDGSVALILLSDTEGEGEEKKESDKGAGEGGDKAAGGGPLAEPGATPASPRGEQAPQGDAGTAPPASSAPQGVPAPRRRPRMRVQCATIDGVVVEVTEEGIVLMANLAQSPSLPSKQAGMAPAPAGTDAIKSATTAGSLTNAPEGAGAEPIPPPPPGVRAEDFSSLSADRALEPSRVTREVQRCVLPSGAVVRHLARGGPQILLPSGDVGEFVAAFGEAKEEAWLSTNMKGQRCAMAMPRPPPPPPPPAEPEPEPEVLSPTKKGARGTTPKDGKRDSKAAEPAKKAAPPPAKGKKGDAAPPPAEEAPPAVEEPPPPPPLPLKPVYKPLEGLRTVVVTDPDTGAVITSREDRVMLVQYPDGRQLAEHSDGTRITSLPADGMAARPDASGGGAVGGDWLVEREGMVKVGGSGGTAVEVALAGFGGFPMWTDSAACVSGGVRAMLSWRASLEVADDNRTSSGAGGTEGEEEDANAVLQLALADGGVVAASAGWVAFAPCNVAHASRAACAALRAAVVHSKMSAEGVGTAPFVCRVPFVYLFDLVAGTVHMADDEGNRFTVPPAGSGGDVHAGIADRWLSAGKQLLVDENMRIRGEAQHKAAAEAAALLEAEAKKSRKFARAKPAAPTVTDASSGAAPPGTPAPATPATPEKITLKSPKAVEIPPLPPLELPPLPPPPTPFTSSSFVLTKARPDLEPLTGPDGVVRVPVVPPPVTPPPPEAPVGKDAGKKKPLVTKVAAKAPAAGDKLAGDAGSGIDASGAAAVAAGPGGEADPAAAPAPHVMVPNPDGSIAAEDIKYPLAPARPPRLFVAFASGEGLEILDTEAFLGYLGQCQRDPSVSVVMEKVLESEEPQATSYTFLRPLEFHLSSSLPRLELGPVRSAHPASAPKALPTMKLPSAVRKTEAPLPGANGRPSTPLAQLDPAATLALPRIVAVPLLRVPAPPPPPTALRFRQVVGYTPLDTAQLDALAQCMASFESWSKQLTVCAPVEAAASGTEPVATPGFAAARWPAEEPISQEEADIADQILRARTFALQSAEQAAAVAAAAAARAQQQAPRGKQPASADSKGAAPAGPKTSDQKAVRAGVAGGGRERCIHGPHDPIEIAARASDAPARPTPGGPPLRYFASEEGMRAVQANPALAAPARAPKREAAPAHVTAAETNPLPTRPVDGGAGEMPASTSARPRSQQEERGQNGAQGGAMPDAAARDDAGGLPPAPSAVRVPGKLGPSGGSAFSPTSALSPLAGLDAATLRSHKFDVYGNPRSPGSALAPATPEAPFSPNERFLAVEDGTARRVNTSSTALLRSRQLVQGVAGSGTSSRGAGAVKGPEGTGAVAQQFSLAPSHVAFGSIPVGGVHSRPLSLLNLSHDVGRFKVKQPELPFKVVYTPAKVAPGMTVKLSVDVAATQVGDYDSVVVIETEFNQFTVPLSVTVLDEKAYEWMLQSQLGKSSVSAAGSGKKAAQMLSTVGGTLEHSG